MIPEAAVEAAAKAYFELCGGKWEETRYRDAELSDMRAALEAAAPHIRAQALEEAAEFVTSPRAKTTDADLTRADAVRNWLRLRAATYRTTK